MHYILKPIRQQLLLDTLEKTIQQQRMERSERAAALDARRIQLQSLLCKLANGISAAIPEGILRDYRIGLLCISTPAGGFCAGERNRFGCSRMYAHGVQRVSEKPVHFCPFRAAGIVA